MTEEEKLPTYYDEWKKKGQEYYLDDGETWVYVQLINDNTLLYSELPPEQKKEVRLRVLVDVLLSKATSNAKEFEAYRSIPYYIGIKFMDFFSNIDLEEIDPNSLKSKLEDAIRSHLPLEVDEEKSLT